MKRIILTIAIASLVIQLFSQNVTISDPAFLAALINEGVDTDGDGLISYDEAEAIDSLDVGDKVLNDMTGIEAFINLKFLKCNFNNLSSLDVSKNTALTFMTCYSNSISSLDVSKNTALVHLSCGENNLTNLDVSKNTALTSLKTWANPLTSLDVSNNTALTYLTCGANNLTSLDVTKNTALQELKIKHTLISSLDLSKNTQLSILNCGYNQFTLLDVSNNTALTYLDISNMPTLYEVCVWVMPFPPAGGDLIKTGSPNVYFTTECVYNNGSIVFIPDTAFLFALIEYGVDTNEDSLISYAEAEALISLDISHRDIYTLTGIEAFVNLDTLDCSSCGLNRLDVSNKTELVHLSCENNQITELDVSNNTVLEQLSCDNNQLTSLDVSNNTDLVHFSCDNNQLSNLDVSSNTDLVHFSCDNNQLANLDVSINSELVDLFISNMPNLYQVCVFMTPFPPDVSPDIFRLDTSGSPNVYFTTECTFDSIVAIPDANFLAKLIDDGVDTNGDWQISYGEAQVIDSMDLSRGGYLKPYLNIYDLTGIESFINLVYLNCMRNNLSNLDVSGNTSLTHLNCQRNNISNLDISSNTALTHLDCQRNNLSNLDISSNTALTYLDCWGNSLINLDVSNNAALTFLNCVGNELNDLDVSSNTALTSLNCGTNLLTSLDISNNNDLFNASNPCCGYLDISNMPTLHEVCVWVMPFPPPGGDLIKTGSPNVYFTTECVYNNDSIVFIPDTAFLFALIEYGVDTNEDSLISYAEAEVVNSLDVSHRDIYTLTGIEAFVNLDTLDCSSCGLNRLDVSNKTELVHLSCDNNQLTSLDVTNNAVLEQLSSDNNQLTRLDVSSNTVLEHLSCDNNQLTRLDISNNTDLVHLSCDNNHLTRLGISNNEALELLSCENSQITGLDVSNNSALTYLECSHNLLTNLDVSINTELIDLFVSNMPTLYQVCVFMMPFPPDVSPDNFRLDTTGSPNVYFTAECTIDSIVTIPDANFLAVLIKEGVDRDKDRQISYAEAEGVMSLDVSQQQISDITGIEAFVNLGTLNCGHNQLCSLDVSNNTALNCLGCSYNLLTNLDLSNNSALELLWCSGNQLTSLDVSNNTALTDLICSNNQISNLNVSNCTALYTLECCNNQLTCLDISNTRLIEWTPGHEPGHLHLYNMPTLEQVCVRALPFPSEYINSFFPDELVVTTGSPNVYFTADCTIGLEDQHINGFSIYPNPSNKLLTIETKDPDCYFLEIHSINGQVIYKEEMEGNSTQIDMTPFSNGIYFITVRSDEWVRTKKVVKN